jgi:outer membrane protein assembly factor BamB
MRFLVLRFAVPLALPVLAAVPVNAGSAAEPAVAMFRGGPDHTGVYGPATGVVEGVDLPLKWRFKTRGKIRSTPVVADGRVFVGSGDGFLYAVDARTGTLVWKFETGGDVSSSPAVAAGVVVFVGGDNVLYAVERDTGKVRWKLPTGTPLKFEIVPGDPRIFDYYGASPTVVGDTIFVGSNDGHVYAVALGDGAVRWKFDAQRWVHGAPAVADGRVFFGDYDGRCYALDQQSGQLSWRYVVEHDPQQPYPGTIVGAPAVAGGRVFFTTNNPTYVLALDAGRGTLLWKAEHPGSMIYASPAVADGVVMAGSSDAHFFQALDAATGAEKWRYDTRARVLTSATIADGLVYFGNTAAYLTVLDVKDGKQKGMSFTEASMHSSAVLHEGVLFVGSDDDYLYAFDRKLKLASAKP